MGREEQRKDLVHGRSSTGYAKEEGGSHLEDQLDHPTRPSFNSIELRSQQSNPKNVASPLTSFDPKPNLFVYANSIESDNRRLGRARLHHGRKRSQGLRGYKRNLRCLLLIPWMYQRGMETLWVMDPVELVNLDQLVSEILQTAINRDKGLGHHLCRTTTLRSSWV
ncbi:unnamed protein product [Microthlaspi erraticum]|uniref:Uncharacterized protein n=1 Tax=Microthlaspi erraticum TaxID=1685480 RepID=A0A6D2HIR1_9BRAS|nr:unnamed protein product [Microthlaspi erraticum]